MRSMKSVIFFCLVAPLLISGCMSMRITTNLKPETNLELKSPAGQFYIASLKYQWADANPGVEIDQQTIKDAERSLLPLVRSECSSRYPALFVNAASATSIPLGVELNCTTTQHPGKTIAWMLCTADICGTIFPAPGDTDEDIDVKAGVWNGRDGIRGASVQNHFQRVEHVWVSIFSPAALITIPGDSDFPKTSGTIMGMQEQMHEAYQVTAEQVSTALATMVAAKDQGFWVVPVGGETTPGTLPAPTTTLSPPTESGTPF